MAALDLHPDELLERLDELTGELADERPDTAFPDQPPLSATCLLAFHDPATRRCVLASAGQPAPLLALPDGEVRAVDVPAGPPLGRGAVSHALTEIDLPEGSVLALRNAGLPDAGPAALREALAAGDGDLQETCDAMARALLPEEPRADAVLLLARARALTPEQVVTWQLPGDRESAAAARRLRSRQLTDWGLAELTFSTELVASELVTNAVRYSTGPVGLRLIRDRALICEVADNSSASPHLRHAAEDDENGRGLYVVAQLTERRGTRHSRSGKAIWTEQPLP
ncbi:ATP-binding SpoIIE family protein phosphatase [Streptomyces litchfieldiae]|uniref:Serine/threonine-protein phosphatase n=1 Tax=Streptomyces litchfieldiae TaxID=3075543 RepID=A0ABU2MXF9_9ACTN|nr:serine/threonine-protein phosphatase [Streptomyces sp. DSM 44938]MDT0346195.1 serine/threonine-protein phosphatase [Streptomyces sp. DSM 44938]